MRPISRTTSPPLKICEQCGFPATLRLESGGSRRYACDEPAHREAARGQLEAEHASTQPRPAQRATRGPLGFDARTGAAVVARLRSSARRS